MLSKSTKFIYTQNKSSLILNSTKLYILSNSASRFNFEGKMGKADQNNIQVNSPSGMLWHWLKLVCRRQNEPVISSCEVHLQ